MKYLDVSEEYVKSVLAANKLLKEEAKIEESTEVEQPQEEIVEETQNHVCPLCESQLEEELSEAKLQECIDFILNTINEVSEEEGESLEESEEEDEATEA